MTYATESLAAERHMLPDLVRAFAVLGIVLVNVTLFAWPLEAGYHDGGLNTRLDYLSDFTVNAFFAFKSFTLFSFIFGVGLAYQIKSAERRGLAFGRQYSRRLLGLFILGGLHITLAYVGDILIMYAIIGAILYSFKDKTVKSLVRWGVVLILLPILLLGLGTAIAYAIDVSDPDEIAKIATELEAVLSKRYKIYRHGSFSEIMTQRWTEWVIYFGFVLIAQGLSVLGFFALGLAAVKSDIISNPSAEIWSKSRKVAFPIGLLISVCGAYILSTVDGSMEAREMLGLTLIMLGSPFATLGYMGWLAKWAAGPDTTFRTFFARGGTATLTAYLMQSIILSLVFCNYGLGLYGKIGAAGCIAIALATGLFTLIFASLWRAKFARGPFEFALRRFTYWGDNR